jgi:hypothetical protein
MGGGDAVDSVLDGIQVALYLAVTSDPPPLVESSFSASKKRNRRSECCKFAPALGRPAMVVGENTVKGVK